VEANEELICDNLEDTVYEDIIRLLTVHDIQMIVYTLEVLYQLSELGEVTTTHIAAVKMAVGKFLAFFLYPV
jgi:AT-rich interactive domain-containing protein 2